MATVRLQDVICSIVKDGILELETEAGYKPDYYGIAKMEGMLLVIDRSECNLQVHNGNDGKLITSHRLDDIPTDFYLISKNEVALCLFYGTVVILSLKSIDDVKLVKTLETGFDICLSLAKWNSDKIVVSGNKDGMMCWGILSIRDGRMDSTHDICEGHWTHIAVKDNIVYISCWTSDSINNGVHVYDILVQQTKKCLYQHQELKYPWSIMADRDYVYVCDYNSNRIHQLTDSGQLLTIHTVSSDPLGIFFDDQQGLLYTTSFQSNVITVYKMESLHQPDSVIPAEVLNMDTRFLQMYKEAFNDGKEKVYNIRVMVVGQYGVGKTTLTQRLLGKNVNISERHSTDGIDVHVECSKVSLPTGEWTAQEKNAEKYSRLQRLVKLLNERVKNQESEGKHDSHVTMVGMVTSEEHNNEHPQHDHPVSAERNITQEVKPPPTQPVQSPIARVNPESNGETGAKKNEKDTVMEILQLINENSGKLENSMIEYAALALWDFAGQYVFYTTHQTFLTSRAIYLLVIDLSQQITDLIKDDECFLDMEGIKLCKVHDFIEIWLNSIHSCEPTSQPGIPPVILVGTHVDKIPEEQTVTERIGEEKVSKVSKKGEDASMDGALSTSIQIGNKDIQDQILFQALDVRAKAKSLPSKHYQPKGVPCSDPKLLCQILQKSQQAASSSQSILEANCLSLGLELHSNTPANGNCFFEAVSSQLRRLNSVVQKSPQELRQEVVAFMKTNRVIQASEGTIHLDSFIYNESFDVYCIRMARDGEWTDHVVVVAMARMLQIDIMIVTSSPSSGPEDIIVWVAGQTAFQGDPILIGHVWESHYMSLKPIEKLHETVLNRCLPNLLKDLNVRDVMMYIQQKELFDAVTIRDIKEQTTTTNTISHLIDQIKKRDQDTYERFKECLILAQRADLKIMLEEEEENIAAEMKEKHQEKLHETVLNRCLPNLLKDLNVRDVMMYIQQKELFDAVTIRDINEQTTTTNTISHLIDQIKKRDQDTYERFKECLILAHRADLKIMLEEEEENIAAEMKEKHQDPRAPERKRRAETSAQKKSKMCLLM